MKKSKQIVASILMWVFLLTNLNITYADYSRADLAKNVYLAKQDLQSESSMQLAGEFDKILTKMSELDNKTKIEKYSKFQKNIKNALSKDIDENTRSILVYMNTKLEKELYFLSDETTDLVSQEDFYGLREWLVNDDFFFQDESEDKEEIEVEELSETQKKDVSEAIMTLQNNALNEVDEYLEKIKENYKKTTQVEARWDLNMSLDIDQEDIWIVNTEVSLTDYVSKKNLFDSEFSWDLKVTSNADLIDVDEDVDVTLSTFFDIISKDFDTYFLLKNLNIDHNTLDDQELAKQVENIEKMFGTNTFFKLPTDQRSKMVIEMYKNMIPEISNFEIKDKLTEPLLESYGKNGNKYLLQPTKYACDKYFELNNNAIALYGFYQPSSCTDMVYNSLVEEFKEIGQVFVTFNDDETYTLGYELVEDDTEIKLDISYSDSGILAINMLVTPDQEFYPGEWFTFNYEKNSHLNMELITDEFGPQIKLESVLDRNNKFTTIDFNATFPKWEIVFTLENRRIYWKIDYIQEWYDYETWQSIDKYSVVWNITWELDFNNKITKLNFDLKQLELQNDNNELYTIDLDYDNHQYFLNFDSEAFKLNSEWQAYLKKLTSSTDYSLTDEYVWNYNWTLNFNYDIEDNKNNSDIEFTLNKEEDWASKQIVKFEMENIWTYDYKEVEIKAPTNYEEIDMDEIQNTLYPEWAAQARDTVRITNLMALKSAVELSYQDYWEYPSQETLAEDISYYIYKIPTDVKEWETNEKGCKYGYYYEVWADENGIENGYYRLSTCLESSSNSFRAESDWWIDDNKYETWFWIDSEDLSEPMLIWE